MQSSILAKLVGTIMMLGRTELLNENCLKSVIPSDPSTIYISIGTLYLSSKCIYANANQTRELSITRWMWRSLLSIINSTHITVLTDLNT